ncbi:hypothetical protein IM660_10335 [Ruania alkalisoli]|uniref:Uncharacterized protein n=1 Tax=Ruania alkalisoli TaxID=2779775 RepID=A0A7M1SQQ4_9MICO|nr:hypothetical protein [Ruania alkalisoli]QOR69132.1 hypothetical protein IM660_10335 [Ruania alkalisoli]
MTSSEHDHERPEMLRDMGRDPDAANQMRSFTRRLFNRPTTPQLTGDPGRDLVRRLFPNNNQEDDN